MLLLNLISKRDMYGYEITQALKKQSEGRLIVKEGSMYPTLYRLEIKNYITSYEKIIGTRMTRVYYHIEESGRELLADMKAEFDDYINLINNMYKWMHLFRLPDLFVIKKIKQHRLFAML